MTDDMPRYGSDDYRVAVCRTSEYQELSDTIHDLGVLVNTYGVRAAVDVMTEWVCAIEYILPPTGKPFRDMTGAVCLDNIHNIENVRQRVLGGTLTVASEKSQQSGIEMHDAFRAAAELADHLITTMETWRPVVSNALRAAYLHRRREPVSAALWNGPGVRERDHARVRDAAAYIHQLAAPVMAVARSLDLPTRPADMQWMAADTRIVPFLSLALSPEGELGRDH